MDDACDHRSVHLKVAALKSPPDGYFIRVDERETLIRGIVCVLSPAKEAEDTCIFQRSAFGRFDLKRFMPAARGFDSQASVEWYRFHDLIAILCLVILVSKMFASRCVSRNVCARFPQIVIAIDKLQCIVTEWPAHNSTRMRCDGDVFADQRINMGKFILAVYVDEDDIALLHAVMIFFIVVIFNAAGSDSGAVCTFTLPSYYLAAKGRLRRLASR